MRISIQSLGCPKNFVDSEVLCGHLWEKKYTLTNQIENSDVAIINTCSFIQPAVEESIDAILQAVRFKEEGKLQYIIVAGCLPQRYQKQELEQSLPEVDAFIGIDEVNMIAEIVEQLKDRKKIYRVQSHPSFIYHERSPRFSMTPRHYAYLKIAEGCNHHCAYCLIPGIRGKYRSRTIESIVAETKNLINHDFLKEIIFIAEDTTYYGKDLYGEPSLSRLLERVVQLPWQEEQKIRILYTHPEHVDNQLIDLIAQHPVICPYLDVPLQHISDAILKRMNRKISQKDILALIEKIRNRIPGITLRTTFIVGFPGETEADFQELVDFVQEYQFEKLGVFPFYNEPECPAHRLSHHVPEEVKKTRLDELMKIQQKIALDYHLKQIGSQKHVLIDEVSAEDERILLGRTCSEAPEIDGNISVLKGNLNDMGRWIEVKITEAYPYHLTGEKLGN